MFTQPKGQTKGQKTCFCQNLFQLMYIHKPKLNVPLRKNHKTPDRKGVGVGVNPYGQPDRMISVFFMTSPNLKLKVLVILYLRYSLWGWNSICQFPIIKLLHLFLYHVFIFQQSTAIFPLGFKESIVKMEKDIFWISLIYLIFFGSVICKKVLATEESDLFLFTLNYKTFSFSNQVNRQDWWVISSFEEIFKKYK